MQWLWGVLPGCALSGGDGGEPQAQRAVRGPGVVGRGKALSLRLDVVGRRRAGRSGLGAVVAATRARPGPALGAPGDLGGQWL